MGVEGYRDGVKSLEPSLQLPFSLMKGISSNIFLKKKKTKTNQTNKQNPKPNHKSKKEINQKVLIKQKPFSLCPLINFA